jgi:hypothetical protein
MTRHTITSDEYHRRNMICEKPSSIRSWEYTPTDIPILKLARIKINMFSHEERRG